jgi:hypothetical protein
MMAHSRLNPVAISAHRNVSYAAHLQQLIKSFTNPSTQTIQLLRDTINYINEAGDAYRSELTQKFLPILVSSNTTNESGTTDRYAILLCKKLIDRNHCDELAGVNGFISYIQRAMTNRHICIARPASSAMMKLIAHSPVPERVMSHCDVDIIPVTRAATANLSSKVDANQCLDAIRVLTILNQESKLSPDNELCDHMVETFYENHTPFVSKQTAGLILTLTENDMEVRTAVSRLLKERAAENKPIQAARCWKEVNDVIIMAAN